MEIIFQEDIGFNERIKMLRHSLSMTQQQVADKIGIERTTYTYYEMGKTEPSLKTLAKLSKLFNVSFDVMIPHKICE